MTTSTILASPALNFLDRMHMGLELVDYRPKGLYEDRNKDDLRNVPISHSGGYLSSDASPGYLKYPEISFEREARGSEHRRNQNRISQQKFRNKNRKAYEGITQALEAERQVSAGLREEISALQSAAKCLTKENQSSLETISKLCNLGSKLAGDAQFEMLGQTIAEGFEVQDHNTNNSAIVAAFCEVEKCPEWDDINKTCPKLRTQDHHQNGKCPKCNPRELLWYKHCNQSKVCDHEYDHMITDVERHPGHDDVVLVSPQYGLCPECTRKGYDQRPGGTNPPPKTPSRMPMDFEDLPREDYSKFESVSKIPSSSLRPVSASRVSQSRLPSNVYNPRASRVPPSNRPVDASEAGSKYSTQAPSQYAPSARPQIVSQREGDPRRQSQSQLSSVSQRPSQRPPTSSAAARPPTAIRQPVSKIGDSKVSSVTPYPYARTKAPPAGEEGPDLDVLLNTPTVMPASKDSESLSPPGGTTYRAVSSVARSSLASKHPSELAHSRRAEVSSTTRPETSRRDSPFAQSRMENASSIPDAPSHSQMHSVSKTPASSSQPPPQRRESSSSRREEVGRRELPSYKTEVSAPSALSRDRSYRSELSSKQSQLPSKQPSAAMSPADLLKRGPPKNVNASAFYDNPDGEEVKAQAEGRAQSSRPSGSCMPKSSVSRRDEPK
ncbi:hypothetical protein V8E51_000014 [Hyaloscypha variabilis]